MFTIAQKKQGTRNVYYRVETDAAGIPVKFEPFDCRVRKREENGKTIYIPFDRLGNIRHDAFQYLNTSSQYDKYYTRELKAKAVNLYHIFCDIMVYDHTRLTTPQIKELVDFLYGVSVKNILPETQRTLRSTVTVRNYYGAIKNYIYDNGWNTAPFEKRTTFTLETTVGDVTFTTKHLKDPNLPRGDVFTNTTAPKHLRPNQARALIAAVIAANDKTTLILIRLQMGHGLRCGEALGITLEDVKRVIKSDGSIRCYIILRNRVSDAPDQFCKGLYHPYDVTDYRQNVYIEAQTWDIDIEEDLYDEIMDYYRSTRERKMSAEKRSRLLSDTRADSVECGTPFPTVDNYYIFVGTNGRRLSAQTYNNHLRKYFAEIGIEPDRLARQNNCSHKLRHTYAMFFSQYLPTTATRVQLRELMRHKSVFSSEPYYTPTVEETLRMKSEFMRSLQDLVPELFRTNE